MTYFLSEHRQVNSPCNCFPSSVYLGSFRSMLNLPYPIFHNDRIVSHSESYKSTFTQRQKKSFDPPKTLSITITRRHLHPSTNTDPPDTHPQRTENSAPETRTVSSHPNSQIKRSKSRTHLLIPQHETIRRKRPKHMHNRTDKIRLTIILTVAGFSRGSDHTHVGGIVAVEFY